MTIEFPQIYECVRYLCYLNIVTIKFSQIYKRSRYFFYSGARTFKFFQVYKCRWNFFYLSGETIKILHQKRITLDYDLITDYPIRHYWKWEKVYRKGSKKTLSSNHNTLCSSERLCTVSIKARQCFTLRQNDLNFCYSCFLVGSS